MPDDRPNEQDPATPPSISSDSEPIDAAMAAAFGPRSDSIASVGHSLSGHADALSPDASRIPPRLLLRELENDQDRVVKQQSEEVPKSHDSDSRYQIHGEMARGGMGAVLRARDADLGRDVAIKVLLRTHQDKPQVFQRFVDEAQIGGQLQHPGIVPVYELGQFADRRPFFTMKLVKGRTLSTCLAERSKVDLDLARFVGIFEQICQTVAYAHSRGVIHRDLKPANVMVGAFGEVQVMDWGLAKVLCEGNTPDRSQTHDAPATEIRTIRGGGQDTSLPQGKETHAGSVMGTAAYMPPEQATGEVESLDERTDVFSLGAILCEILTDGPAYQGPSDVAYEQAKRADLREALTRLDACPADADLVVLAKRCLSPEKVDRPRHAGELADAISAQRAGVQKRLRAAELRQAAAAAREQEAVFTANAERRARRMTVATAVAVLLLAFGGATSWRISDQQQRTKKAELADRHHKIELAFREVTTLSEEEQWTAAHAAAVRVRALLDDSIEIKLRHDVLEVLDDLRLTEQIDLATNQALDIDPNNNSFVPARAIPVLTKAFQDYGIIVEQSDLTLAAAKIRSRPKAVVDQVVAGLLLLIVHEREDPDTRSAWLRKLLDLIDDDPWRARFRIALIQRDRAECIRLASDTDVARQPPTFQVNLANALSRLDEPATAINLMRRACELHPDDWRVNVMLGVLYFFNSRRYVELEENPPLSYLSESIRHFTIALVLRPDLAANHLNLGAAFQLAGDSKAAIEAYENALEINPEYTAVTANLAIVYRQAGKVDTAMAILQKVIDRDQQPSLALAELGGIHLRNGDLAKARELLEEAVRLDPQILNARMNIGIIDLRMGHLDAAMAHFLWVTENGTRAIHLRALAESNLASTLRQVGRLTEAYEHIQEAIRLEPHIGQAHLVKGLILVEGGKFVEAIQSFRKALDHLDEKHPSHASATKELRIVNGYVEGQTRLEGFLAGTIQPEHPLESVHLGYIALCRGHYISAVELFEAGFAQDPRLAEKGELGWRLYAALAATQASIIRSSDGLLVQEDARNRYRQMALEWLKADYLFWEESRDSNPLGLSPLGFARLGRMIHDSTFDALRGEAALAKMSPFQRSEFRTFWLLVNQLLNESLSP